MTMTRNTERTVYLLIITALGGLIAGLVMAFTLWLPSQHDVEKDTAAEVTEVAEVAEPDVTARPWGDLSPDPEAETQPETQPEPDEPTHCEPSTLEVQTTWYKPGDKIHFRITDGLLGQNAWVGLIPTGIPHGSDTVNDEHDVTYAYVEADTSVTLVAPSRQGLYDLRLHSRYPDGKEIASVTIEVGGGCGLPARIKTEIEP